MGQMVTLNKILLPLVLTVDFNHSYRVPRNNKPNTQGRTLTGLLSFRTFDFLSVIPVSLSFPLHLFLSVIPVSIRYYVLSTLYFLSNH